jgi:hypothetical protein
MSTTSPNCTPATQAAYLIASRSTVGIADRLADGVHAVAPGDAARELDGWS